MLIWFNMYFSILPIFWDILGMLPVTIKMKVCPEITHSWDCDHPSSTSAMRRFALAFRVKPGGMGPRNGTTLCGGPENATSCVVLLHGLGDTAEGWVTGAQLLTQGLPETRFLSLGDSWNEMEKGKRKVVVKVIWYCKYGIYVLIQ